MLRPTAKLPNAKAVMENCLRNTVFSQLDGTQLQAAQRILANNNTQPLSLLLCAPFAVLCGRHLGHRYRTSAAQ
jgi:hypothetical protein